MIFIRNSDFAATAGKSGTHLPKLCASISRSTAHVKSRRRTSSRRRSSSCFAGCPRAAGDSENSCCKFVKLWIEWLIGIAIPPSISDYLERFMTASAAERGHSDLVCCVNFRKGIMSLSVGNITVVRVPKLWVFESRRFNESPDR